MKITEKCFVFRHELEFQMESVIDRKVFLCEVRVDGKVPRKLYYDVSNLKTENFAPEILKEILRESLTYAEYPSLDIFQNKYKIDDIVKAKEMFHRAKDTHIWLSTNFSKEEISHLYKMLDNERKDRHPSSYLKDIEESLFPCSRKWNPRRPDIVKTFASEFEDELCDI